MLRGDTTYLRLQAAGSPENGRNGLRIADGSDAEYAGPALVVLACPPPPTPTPQPGCHIDTFTPASNGWTAQVYGESYPPATFIGCESDNVFRTAGTMHLVLPPPFASGWWGSNALLQWDTSSIPEDAVVYSVELKAIVAANHSDAAASLTADWFAWVNNTDCEEEENPACCSADYTDTTNLGDALSTAGACGDACLLPNIPVRDSLFPLDDAAAHLSHSSEVPTQLRVRVDLGESPAVDSIAVADLTSSWPPAARSALVRGRRANAGGDAHPHGDSDSPWADANTDTGLMRVQRWMCSGHVCCRPRGSRVHRDGAPERLHAAQLVRPRSVIVPCRQRIRGAVC